jgi:hypothetical protein
MSKTWTGFTGLTGYLLEAEKSLNKSCKSCNPVKAFIGSLFLS